MPVYAYNTDLNKWQSIVTAFTSALQEFTINLGAGDILKMADGCFSLQIYLSLFLIVSPILTVGALLSLLKDYFAKIRMGRSPRIMIGTLIKYVSLFPEYITAQ